MSSEQMVRDLLEQAIKDGLVALNRQSWTDPDPQRRSAGELAGVANLLGTLIRHGVDNNRILS